MAVTSVLLLLPLLLPHCCLPPAAPAASAAPFCPFSCYCYHSHTQTELLLLLTYRFRLSPIINIHSSCKGFVPRRFLLPSNINKRPEKPPGHEPWSRRRSHFAYNDRRMRCRTAPNIYSHKSHVRMQLSFVGRQRAPKLFGPLWLYSSVQFISDSLRRLSKWVSQSDQRTECTLHNETN